MDCKDPEELRELFLLVADICDSGACYDMKGGGHRYDGLRYGAALMEKYQNALQAEPASSWYDDATEEANGALAANT